MATTANRGSKDFEELRHRAAYVHATGWLPTHLREHMTALLAKITRYSRQATSLDGRSGSLMVPECKVRSLHLDKHPMVERVRAYVDAGYSIQPRRAPKARRPFGKVFMYRETPTGVERVTVQSDGSVLDRW